MSGKSFKFFLSPGGVPGLRVISFQHHGGGEPCMKGPLGTGEVVEWERLDCGKQVRRLRLVSRVGRSQGTDAGVLHVGRTRKQRP